MTSCLLPPVFAVIWLLNMCSMPCSYASSGGIGCTPTPMTPWPQPSPHNARFILPTMLGPSSPQSSPQCLLHPPHNARFILTKNTRFILTKNTRFILTTMLASSSPQGSLHPHHNARFILTKNTRFILPTMLASSSPQGSLHPDIHVPKVCVCVCACLCVRVCAGPSSCKDDAVCIICLDCPVTIGVLHGDTVHRCLCLKCSRVLGVGQPCPVCRQRSHAFVKVY